MPDPGPLNARLRKFVTTNFMIAPEEAGFGDDDSLLQLGLIDSMGVMEIVGYLKKEFGVTAEPSEIRPENFDSIRAIAGFIGKKSKA